MPVIIGGSKSDDALRRKGMHSRLQGFDDPTQKGMKVRVKEVLRVYEPDPRGLVEVLYLTHDNEPMTALVDHYLPAKAQLVSLSDGW